MYPRTGAPPKQSRPWQPGCSDYTQYSQESAPQGRASSRNWPSSADNTSGFMTPSTSGYPGPSHRWDQPWSGVYDPQDEAAGREQVYGGRPVTSREVGPPGGPYAAPWSQSGDRSERRDGETAYYPSSWVSPSPSQSGPKRRRESEEREFPDYSQGSSSCKQLKPSASGGHRDSWGHGESGGRRGGSWHRGSGRRREGGWGGGGGGHRASGEDRRRESDKYRRSKSDENRRGERGEDRRESDRDRRRESDWDRRRESDKRRGEGGEKRMKEEFPMGTGTGYERQHSNPFPPHDRRMGYQRQHRESFRPQGRGMDYERQQDEPFPPQDSRVDYEIQQGKMFPPQDRGMDYERREGESFPPQDRGMDYERQEGELFPPQDRGMDYERQEGEPFPPQDRGMDYERQEGELFLPQDRGMDCEGQEGELFWPQDSGLDYEGQEDISLPPQDRDDDPSQEVLQCDICPFFSLEDSKMKKHLKKKEHYSASKFLGSANPDTGRVELKYLSQPCVFKFHLNKWKVRVPACVECYRTFVSLSHCMSHTLAAHNVNGVYSLRTVLYSKTFVMNKDFDQCLSCPEKFSGKGLLEHVNRTGHMRRYNGEKSEGNMVVFPCLFCPLVEANYFTYKGHVLQKHGDKVKDTEALEVTCHTLGSQLQGNCRTLPSQDPTSRRGKMIMDSFVPVENTDGKLKGFTKTWKKRQNAAQADEDDGQKRTKNGTHKERLMAFKKRRAEEMRKASGKTGHKARGKTRRRKKKNQANQSEEA